MWASQSVVISVKPWPADFVYLRLYPRKFTTQCGFLKILNLYRTSRYKNMISYNAYRDIHNQGKLLIKAGNYC